MITKINTHDTAVFGNYFNGYIVVNLDNYIIDFHLITPQTPVSYRSSDASPELGLVSGPRDFYLSPLLLFQLCPAHMPFVLGVVGGNNKFKL